MNSPHSILKQFWGFADFRPGQEEIIKAVLDNQDVLAILPTGGGKSVCFQVPAMLKPGLCLVVTPLIALMKDQVANLVKKNIKAIAIHSGMNNYEVKETFQKLLHGDYKFLYVSPERLKTRIFKEYLESLDVSMLAVDEAHCVSQWGYDFRPPYLTIAEIRESLPNIPVIALTASATTVVADDIKAKLKLRNPGVFRQSFTRPNLSFSAFEESSKINKALEILNKVPGSAIIYCGTRKQTKLVATLLRGGNISADFYHAGLNHEERAAKQTAWIDDQTRVMVCTNAFGMGIDKPGVRTVIHYDIPDCLENYYQEAGRAGRDGKQSFAVLLYSKEDIAGLKQQPDLHFPTLPEIRNVYQQLCDHLQIDAGCGEGLYYDFDIMRFIKLFNLDMHLTINAIKVLETEGFISVTDSFYIPSRVAFTTNKQTLTDFEQMHPELDEIIKILLRTYQGIYDNEVSVYEKQIARLLKYSYQEVVEKLKLLHAYHIIEYKQQKETPQVYFNLNRIPASYLNINNELYAKRKQLYTERVSAMVNYALLAEQCRSRYIASYFDDKTAADCGSCDNCLDKKGNTLTTHEFKLLEARIYQHASSPASAIQALTAGLRPNHKARMLQVLNYLLDEKKVRLDPRGNLVKC